VVARLVVLDVVPTATCGGAPTATSRAATGTGGSSPCRRLLPERLIGGDRRRSSSSNVRAGMGLGREPGRYYSLEILAAYWRILDGPEADVARG